MPSYCLAGRDFCISVPLPTLASFEKTSRENDGIARFVPRLSCEDKLIARTWGWVGSALRCVEVHATSGGLLLKVAGSNDIFINPQGEIIVKSYPDQDVSQLDREILVGPALTLALALRGVWSLHASATIFRERVIVFLGESGSGKSTLARYLSSRPGWCSVADGILPVTSELSGLVVWPHFPQFKLPPESQPWLGLPEQLPLNVACVLEAAKSEQKPEIHELSIPQAAQAFIGHIAGTRLFPPDLLKKHLEFSAKAAAKVPTYRLIDSQSRATLPQVGDLLEQLS